MEKRSFLRKLLSASLIVAALSLLVAASIVQAHEKVKLTGYVLDSVCYADEVKGTAEEANKAAGEHSKECALMDECIKSGYGIYADGKWYPFDAKGNELAKAAMEKTSKKDHVKMTVEGMKHDGKILVEKITEAD